MFIFSDHAHISGPVPILNLVFLSYFCIKKMKQLKSLSLGPAYSQMEQLLSMEQELSEITFHYGAGVRLHLDSIILGIRHAKELLAHLIVSKYADHQPLNRQIEILRRNDFHLSAPTASEWCLAGSPGIVTFV